MAKTATTDADVIVDEGKSVTLESGTELILQPLKARQFFKLLRIITHGAGGMLLNIKFSADDSPEEFGGKLMALIGFAIPDAEDEVMDFILSMVKPAKEKSGRNLTKSEALENKRVQDELLEELYNPELGDLVTILEAIVKRESSDLQALGKRLMQMFDVAKKTGQVPANLTE
jgi:hypothetical protein